MDTISGPCEVVEEQKAVCEFGAVSVSFPNLYSAPSKARNPFHLAHSSELDPFSSPPLKHRRLAFALSQRFALRASTSSFCRPLEVETFQSILLLHVKRLNEAIIKMRELQTNELEVH